MKTTEKLTPIIYFGGSTEGVINTTRSNIKTPSDKRMVINTTRSNIKTPSSSRIVINTTRSNIKTPSSSRVAKGRSNIKNNRYETEPIIIVIEASNDGVINTTRSNIKTVHD